MVSVCVCARLCVVYIKTCVTVNKTMGLKHTVYSGLKVSNNHWTTIPTIHLCLDYNFISHCPLKPWLQEPQYHFMWTSTPYDPSTWTTTSTTPFCLDYNIQNHFLSGLDYPKSPLSGLQLPQLPSVWTTTPTVYPYLEGIHTETWLKRHSIQSSPSPTSVQPETAVGHSVFTRLTDSIDLQDKSRFHVGSAGTDQNSQENRWHQKIHSDTKNLIHQNRNW